MDPALQRFVENSTNNNLELDMLMASFTKEMYTNPLLQHFISICTQAKVPLSLDQFTGSASNSEENIVQQEDIVVALPREERPHPGAPRTMESTLQEGESIVVPGT